MEPTHVAAIVARRGVLNLKDLLEHPSKDLRRAPNREFGSLAVIARAQKTIRALMGCVVVMRASAINVCKLIARAAPIDLFARGGARTANGLYSPLGFVGRAAHYFAPACTVRGR